MPNLPPSIWRVIFSMGTGTTQSRLGETEAVIYAQYLSDFQVRDTRGAATFESMYDSTLDKVLNGTGRETFDAVKLMQSIQKQNYTPAAGAKYPSGRFAQNLMQIARLIKA